MSSNTHHGLWLGLFFTIGFAFYYGLGLYGLANNNEGLYAEIAREMYISHQYIIPTLNGVLYIEKPPLLYWLITGCFHLWGTTEFAARFIPATGGLLVCFALVFFAQQINRLREGMLAALILSTSLGFILIARIVFFDMLFTAMFTLSLMCFYLASFLEPVQNLYYFGKKKLYMQLGYFFLALSVLTKGLIALCLVPMIVGSLLLCTHTFRTHWKSFLDPAGIILFLLITVPWHTLAAVQHPGFLQDFFVNEQFLRFLDKRVPHDYYTGPFYYYLPRIFLYLLPWGILLPLVFLEPVQNLARLSKKALIFCIAVIPNRAVCGEESPTSRRRFLANARNNSNAENQRFSAKIVEILNRLLKKYRENSFKDPLKMFAWLWLLIPLVFFSLSKAKANYYMVISCPALAILLAQAIYSDFLKQRWTTAWRLIIPVFTFISLSCVALAVHIAKNNEKQFSAKSIVQTLRHFDSQFDKRPIFIFQEFEALSSLRFYLNQPLKIIDSRSKDLWYGSRFAPKNLFINMQSFTHSTDSKNCYVVLKQEQLPVFYAKNPYHQLHPVITFSKWAVLSNVITNSTGG